MEMEMDMEMDVDMNMGMNMKITRKMRDLPAFGQSGTGIKKSKMPNRSDDRIRQRSPVFIGSREDAEMPTPALVSYMLLLLYVYSVRCDALFLSCQSKM